MLYNSETGILAVDNGREVARSPELRSRCIIVDEIGE
jgi:hypothetical protein